MNYSNGISIFALIAALILTIPLSMLLTRLFKEKVEKMINSENDFSMITPEPVLLPNPAPFPGIKKLNKEMSSSQSGTHPGSTYLAHLITGLLVSLILLYVVYLQFETLSWLVSVYLFLCLSFPLLFVVYVLNTPGSRLFARTVLLYFTVHILILSYFFTRNDSSNVFTLISIFLIRDIWITAIFFWLQSSSTIKSIAPYLFPALYIGVIFHSGMISLFDSNQDVLEGTFHLIYDIFAALNLADLSASGFFLILTLVMVLTAVAALLFLRTAYASKNINGQILLIDCLWITQVIYMTSMPYNDHRAITYALLIVVIYKLTQWALLRFFRDKPLTNAPQQLLILRVFSLGDKSEKLFKHVSTSWLSQGHIVLIAGFDLTNSLVDIDDLLTYLSGQIKKRFCLNEALIYENVNKIDSAPDIDNRYRVNEMYCNNSTWKTVLNKLLPGTTKVMMDLRGFTTERSGCIHEIKQLINVIPIENILFVTDTEGTREDSDMCKIMRAAWEKLPLSSPNYGHEQTGFFVYEYTNNRDIAGLIHCLKQKAYASPVVL